MQRQSKSPKSSCRNFLMQVIWKLCHLRRTYCFCLVSVCPSVGDTTGMETIRFIKWSIYLQSWKRRNVRFVEDTPWSWENAFCAERQSARDASASRWEYARSACLDRKGSSMISWEDMWIKVEYIASDSQRNVHLQTPNMYSESNDLKA